MSNTVSFCLVDGSYNTLIVSPKEGWDHPPKKEMALVWQQTAPDEEALILELWGV